MALAAGQTGHLADHQEAAYVVDHGATAGTARPTLGSASTAPTVVLWNGSVEPTNAVNGDWWFDSANTLVKVKESGSFVASGSEAYALASQAFYVPAKEFELASGSPAYERMTGTTRPSLWKFDSSSSEYIEAAIFIPRPWTSVDVDVYWTNLGAGSGQVEWELNMLGVGDGDDMNTFPTAQATINPTAPAQYVTEVTELAAAVAVTPGDLQYIRFRRDPSGTDDLANDAGMWGLRFRDGA